MAVVTGVMDILFIVPLIAAMEIPVITITHATLVFNLIWKLT